MRTRSTARIAQFHRWAHQHMNPSPNIAQLVMMTSISLTCHLFGSDKPAGCLRFDELAAGHQYFVGEAFLSGDVRCEVEPFQSPDGIWTFGGMATIQSDPFLYPDLGNGSPFLWFNNVNVRFNVGYATELVLRYGAYGGDQNIRVNGALMNFRYMSALDDTVLGNAVVTVADASVPGGTEGELRIRGRISDFAIGGQEFAVDDVCVTQLLIPVIEGISVVSTNSIRLTFFYAGSNASELVLQSTESLRTNSIWTVDSNSAIAPFGQHRFEAISAHGRGMEHRYYRIQLPYP